MSIKNFFKKIHTYVLQKYDSYHDNQLLKSLLTDVEKTDYDTYKILLTNSINSSNQQLKFRSPSRKTAIEEKRRWAKITKQVIAQTLVLKHIVGIQPMVSPCSLIYLLRYTNMDTQLEQSDALGTENGKRVTLSVVTEVTEAKTRKLQACWNVEAAQDVKHLHGLDIKDEIISAAANEISFEIISEVINDLVTIGDKNNITSAPIQYAPLVNGMEQLMVTITKQANTMAQDTRRGPGNVIITNPIGVSLLQSVSGGVWKYEAITTEPNYCSLAHVGNIVTSTGLLMYKVMRSNTFPADATKFLVVYKGMSGECDTGYVYSPYVLAGSLGSVVADSATVQPTERIVSRYGKWFGTIPGNNYGDGYYKSITVDIT